MDDKLIAPIMISIAKIVFTFLYSHFPSHMGASRNKLLSFEGTVQHICCFQPGCYRDIPKKCKLRCLPGSLPDRFVNSPGDSENLNLVTSPHSVGTTKFQVSRLPLCIDNLLRPTNSSIISIQCCSETTLQSSVSTSSSIISIQCHSETTLQSSVSDLRTLTSTCNKS